MKSIMKAMYRGENIGGDGLRPPDPEYNKLSGKISVIKEHFEQILPPNEWGKFEEMMGLECERSNIEDIYLFKNAMCIGMLLMMDVLDFCSESEL